MIKAKKIQSIQDALFEGNLKNISTADLKLYREHFDELSRLLNISGKQFRPSFEYAIKQHSTTDDIIRARERK
jgi:hypothetical protein